MNFILDFSIIAVFLISFFVMAKKGFAKAIYSLGANVLALILLSVILTPAADAVLKTQIGDKVRENINEIILKNTPEISADIADNAVLENEFAPVIKKQLIKQGIENATYNSVEAVTGLIVKIITAVILFILLRFILSILFKLLSTILKLPLLAQINALAGGAAGVVNALLIVYIACAVISLSFDWTKPLQLAADNTLIFKFFYMNNLLINIFI